MPATELSTERRFKLRSLAERFGRAIEQACDADTIYVGSCEFLSKLDRAGDLLLEAGQLLKQAASNGLTEAHAEDHHAWDPAVSRAADQYQYAVNCLQPPSGKARVTDRAAYEYLKSLYAQSPHNMNDQFAGLASYATWTRYLRAFRKATGQQKNKRRTAGRVAEHRVLATSQESGEAA